MDNEIEKVELKIEDQVAFLGINRPEKLNALSWEMMTTLDTYVEKIDENRDIRAVILYSKVARTFGVGADITDWGSLEPVEMWRKWVRHGHRIIRNLEELLQPVIAVTNGYTFGGSLELALAADIRIGEVNSLYGFPEATVGTIPGWLGTQKALQLIGPSKLKKLIFTGQPIPVENAYEIGLIDEIAPESEGLTRAIEITDHIRQSSPIAVSLAKQVVNSLAAANQPVTALESIASGLAAQTADGKEGKLSFKEKRKPTFSGF